ncbi:general odorant-binding protein 99b-like [Ochlerotatus camptorhynchus]|uniref:general odorant-binding protein 99b-like n=1 Tax=Ochlerotatus camptorhynchus TaxID=644619 RepID=UPI0031D2848A
MKPVQVLGLLVIVAVFLAAPANAGELVNRLISVCTHDQKPSAELLERYKNGDFPDDRDSKCVMRCIGLNLGVYDDINGVHMHDTWQMFRQGRAATEEKAFADQHNKCIKQQTKNVPADDYCGQVYAVFQCYKDEYLALLTNIRKAAAKAQG